jgi:hypothetical protein
LRRSPAVPQQATLDKARGSVVDEAMSDVDPTGTDWTDTEVDLIVADYFDMLRLERADKPFVKAHRNAALQELTGRSRGSIEFKHQNISAVLLKLGMDWITGYKPMANFQGGLLAGVERYLDVVGDAALVAPPAIATGMGEAASLLSRRRYSHSPPPILPLWRGWSGSSTLPQGTPATVNSVAQGSRKCSSSSGTDCSRKTVPISRGRSGG